MKRYPACWGRLAQGRRGAEALSLEVAERCSVGEGARRSAVQALEKLKLLGPYCKRSTTLGRTFRGVLSYIVQSSQKWLAERIEEDGRLKIEHESAWKLKATKSVQCAKAKSNRAVFDRHWWRRHCVELGTPGHENARTVRERVEVRARFGPGTSQRFHCCYMKRRHMQRCARRGRCCC